MNQTHTITIQKISTQQFDTGDQYKLTADEKTYKFYSTKKDGSPTMAYEQFKDMGLKVGSVCEIWFEEQEKEYQGKPYTDRIIRSFREATTKSIQTQPKPMQTPTVPYKNGNDAFGRRLALHGFVNARLVNHTIKQVADEIIALLALEDDIEKILDRGVKFGDDSKNEEPPFYD